MSPYPTVVAVIMAQYSEVMYWVAKLVVANPPASLIQVQVLLQLLGCKEA
jgi:hypothetical protein